MSSANRLFEDQFADAEVVPLGDGAQVGAVLGDGALLVGVHDLADLIDGAPYPFLPVKTPPAVTRSRSASLSDGCGLPRTGPRTSCREIPFL